MVPDASLVIAALTERTPIGKWAADWLTNEPLFAPAMAPAEVTNVLRRLEITGRLSPEKAAIACADLLRVNWELVGFGSVAQRVWSLRHNLSAYDAWYVAVAERMEHPLVTLDLALSRAPGLQCEVITPALG